MKKIKAYFQKRRTGNFSIVTVQAREGAEAEIMRLVEIQLEKHGWYRFYAD